MLKTDNSKIFMKAALMYEIKYWFFQTSFNDYLLRIKDETVSIRAPEKARFLAHQGL